MFGAIAHGACLVLCCDTLQVVNNKTQSSWSFYHANWLDSDTTSVTLYPNCPMVEYKVRKVHPFA